MDRVATDILGPFPQSESGNRYVLLVTISQGRLRLFLSSQQKLWPKNLSMNSSPDLAPHLTYIQIRSQL